MQNTDFFNVTAGDAHVTLCLKYLIRRLKLDLSCLSKLLITVTLMCYEQSCFFPSVLALLFI